MSYRLLTTVKGTEVQYKMGQYLKNKNKFQTTFWTLVFGIQAKVFLNQNLKKCKLIKKITIFE